MTRRPSDGFLVALAVLLAFAHGLLALTAKTSKSSTADEIGHVTAGLAYNTLGDFRLQPENGALPQRWAALPATLTGAPLPPASSETWQRADVWRFGHTFFYGQALSSDEILFHARAMIALFSAATGVLVFFWSRALFGWRGGFVSLVLFMFCPAFLAHGALATSDVVMTFFFLAAMGAWWRHLERPGVAGATLSAAVFGLACVAKYSAVLLLPMFALCAACWVAAHWASAPRGQLLLRVARSAVLHAVAAWLIIWLFYGTRFQAFAPELAAQATFYRGDWNWILSDMGWPRAVIEALRDWRVLPEAFLYGFAFVLQFARERAAFLNGDYSTTGWVSFFPFAFLVKSTLPMLVLVCAGAVLAVQRVVTQRAAAFQRLWPLVPLLVLFALYWATSLASNLNIGHRHILPTYPVLFIAAGWLGRLLDRRTPLAAAAIASLVGWHSAEALRTRPHHLAYFNQLVGGSSNGWRHLVDSSLDWGQDLPALKTWLDANGGGERVFLAYFGAGDPEYEGIRATLLPRLLDVGAARPWHPLSGGIYAVSATLLQQVYTAYRGDWTAEREAEFQQLRALEPLLLAYDADPRRRAELLREAPAANWNTAWRRYEQLRFARLCHCLRPRTPVGTAGHSIRIYRLTDAEVAAATAGSIHEWRALIERTVTGPKP